MRRSKTTAVSDIDDTTRRTWVRPSCEIQLRLSNSNFQYLTVSPCACEEVNSLRSSSSCPTYSTLRLCIISCCAPLWVDQLAAGWMKIYIQPRTCNLCSTGVAHRPICSPRTRDIGRTVSSLHRVKLVRLSLHSITEKVEEETRRPFGC